MRVNTTLLALLLLWLSEKEHGTEAEAFSWLMRNGAWQALADILRPVLGDLWTQAWLAGLSAAESLSGPSGAIPGIPSGEQFSDTTGRDWINQIIRHRLEQIAAVLAASDGDPQHLEGELRALLGDEAWAQMVAITEVVRAMQEASRHVYRANGVHLVRWVIADAAACPACKANANAGPWPAGTPFPSGAIAPPEHPRCRCALVPA